MNFKNELAKVFGNDIAAANEYVKQMNQIGMNGREIQRLNYFVKTAKLDKMGRNKQTFFY